MVKIKPRLFFKRKSDYNPFESLENKEFRLLIAIRFLMTMGFAIQFLVIEWHVYHITNDPLNLGLIGLAEIIPAISFSFFSGHVVERSEKRNALLLCLLGSLLVSIGYLTITWKDTHSQIGLKTALIVIYCLVFTFGAIRSFFGPSAFSLFGLILPKRLYANGTTWYSSTWQIGTVLGAATGGLLYGSFGITIALLVSFSFMLIATVLLLLIKKKEIVYQKNSESKWESLISGFKFVFNHKIVLSALALDMFAVLFGGAVALLPVFAKDILHVGPTGLGILRAAPSVGAILTMVSISFFPVNKNTGKKLLAFVFGFGLCIVAFGFSEWFYLSLFVLFLSGIFDGVSMIIRQTILQLFTPDDMRGRVSAVNSMFVGSSNELGAFESGVTAKWLGTIPAVVMGGCITMAVVLGVGAWSKPLRELEFKDIDFSEKKD